MSISDLHDRTVVVTGGTGFIGRPLVRALARSGADRVIVVGRNESVLEDLRCAGKGSAGVPVRGVRRDILRPGDLEEVIEPDSFVVHLAAMTHAGVSIQEPEPCFRVNAMGTVRVLEACRVRDAAGVLFVSTGLVYGAPHYLPIDEEHPTEPLSPYAASKLAAEGAVFAYASNYGLPACIARLSNVYGAGGHPDAVHSLVVRQILDGGPVELLDLSSVRDFIHVGTAVEGLIRLLGVLDPGSRLVVNLSSGRGHSVEEFAKAHARAFQDQGGGSVVVRQKGSGNLSSVREIVLDNTRLFEATGWRPRPDELEERASETIAESVPDRSPGANRSSERG